MVGNITTGDPTLERSPHNRADVDALIGVSFELVGPTPAAFVDVTAGPRSQKLLTFQSAG